MTARRTGAYAVVCHDDDGTLLAEGRAANTMHAAWLARFLVDAVPDATTAHVPRSGYQARRTRVPPRHFRVSCSDATTLLAEGRASTVSAAQRLAAWMLDNVPGATGAYVPHSLYEIVRR